MSYPGAICRCWWRYRLPALWGGGPTREVAVCCGLDCGVGLYVLIYLRAENAELASGGRLVFLVQKLRTRVSLVFVLLVYSFASVLPVWFLLQPRDFINSHQLVVGLSALILGPYCASSYGGAGLSGGS